MISVIVATNRLNSMSGLIANGVYNELKDFVTSKVKIGSLANLVYSDFTNKMYEDPPLNVKSFALEFLIQPKKLVFVIPEYNGSFPGVLKLMIDLASTVNYKGVFLNKDVILIGVSEGRAGNLIGLNHFASIVQHMGGILRVPNLPISNVNKQFDTSLQLNDITKKKIQNQLKKWLV